jgi:hypothetical protein
VENCGSFVSVESRKNRCFGKSGGSGDDLKSLIAVGCDDNVVVGVSAAIL